MATPVAEKEFPQEKTHTIPSTFLMRRLHSLLGLWLSLYLFQHLLINSQAAFYRFDGGEGFISMVNRIHDMPYLKVIEITLLAFPFLFHGIWGIFYVRSAKYNSFRTDGTSPMLPQYKKNRAYTWQRISSWILLVGIIAHVVHMRYLEFPYQVHEGEKSTFFITQRKSDLLEKMSIPLHLTIYDQPMGPITHLAANTVVVGAPSAGVAFLLIVRDVFTQPMMVILYSILVLVAAFHGYNGLWTALITWGVLRTHRMQRQVRYITKALMAIVILLGLTAAWGSYLL